MDHKEEDRSEDRLLVDSFLKDRSESSFRRLYRRHTPRMLRLAVLCGDPDFGPEDVVQEAWVRATRSLEAFAWRSSLSTWLAGFVVNVGREYRRSSQSRRKALIDSGEREIIEPEAADPATLIALSDALRELPYGFRAVVALHDLGGFTHAEIAGMLGIEPGTSKSQLARARRRLRDRLEGTMNGNRDDEE